MKALRKKQRRLDYLCTQYAIPFEFHFRNEKFDIDKELERISKYKEYNPTQPTRLLWNIELYELAKELKYTNEVFLQYWRKKFYNQKQQHMQYKARPIQRHVENPNLYGEEFRGSGTIRRPKKCRKSAWKRFNKLFPKLKK